MPPREKASHRPSEAARARATTGPTTCSTRRRRRETGTDIATPPPADSPSTPGAAAGSADPDRFLVVDHRRLEIRWVGAPDSELPTLVFLHEGLGSVALWKDFPDRLAEATGWPALVWSRLGYGGSDPAPLPRPVTFLDDEAESLPRFLAAAGVGPTVLVGHSDGASIALGHAARLGAASLGGDLLAVIAEAPHVMVEELTLTSIRAAGTAFGEGELRRRLARYHRDVDAAFRGFHDVWLDPEFASWSLEARLPAVQVPVLVVQGEDDPYGTRRQVDAIRERSGGPVETLLLPPPCGHSPHVTRAGEVLAAMADFLRRRVAVASRGPALR